MTPLTVAGALQDASNRLVGDPDVAGNLVALLTDCCALLGAEAAGALVAGSAAGLEVLGSTSHQGGELELYDLQHATGPCAEAIRRNAVVTLSVTEPPAEWPQISDLMLAAGFRRLYAFPLRWHQEAFGALSVFTRRTEPLDTAGALLGQTFANLAAVLIAHPLEAGLESLDDPILRALEGRYVIEKAKGVVAYQRRVEMAGAFVLLLRSAEDQQLPLAEVARRLVDGRGVAELSP